MDELRIERIGGLAGFGLPGSRLQSRGQCAWSDLSKADQAAVEALFAGKAKAALPGAADTFRYRITRVSSGKTKTVEVPESSVPASLAARVKDELK